MRIRSLFIVGRSVARGRLPDRADDAARRGRRRSQADMLVSEQEIEKGAEVAYDQELDKAQAEGRAEHGQADVSARAERSRAADSADRRVPPDAPQWKWEVNVQTSEDVNAYCMPGGKIMVYTGLIEQLNATDAELAAVIGHEIAHALREHSRERMSRAYAEQLALAGIAVATGASETHDAAREPGFRGDLHSCRTAASRKPRRIASAWS